MFEIDHLGIRVSHLDELLERFRNYFNTEITEDVDSESKRRICYVEFNNCRLELVEDQMLRSGQKVVAELDHFAIGVPDIDEEIRRGRHSGLEITDAAPREGAFGRSVAAIDASAFAGIKSHLVQMKDRK